MYTYVLVVAGEVESAQEFYQRILAAKERATSQGWKDVVHESTAHPLEVLIKGMPPGKSYETKFEMDTYTVIAANEIETFREFRYRIEAAIKRAEALGWTEVAEHETAAVSRVVIKGYPPEEK